MRKKMESSRGEANLGPFRAGSGSGTGAVSEGYQDITICLESLMLLVLC